MSVKNEKIIEKNKVKDLPVKEKRVKKPKVKKPQDKEPKFNKKAILFPGCVIKNRLPFLEKSARLVFNKLGVEIEDAPFVCCPDPCGVASISEESWLILAARNLTFGEEDNKVILSLCNGCSETLLRAKHVLKHDRKKLKEVKFILNSKRYYYRGKTEVAHFVKTLYKDIGVKKIKEIVEDTWASNDEKKNPIEGLRIAVHPGCHYNKPSEVLRWDNPRDPKYQEKLIKAIGGIPVKYKEKTLCCGAGVTRTREDIGFEIIRRKYNSAREAGAKIISVNCPACFQQLESNQRSVNKKFEESYMIPIFYITELIAIAFGYTPAEIGLKFHSIGKKTFDIKVPT